jgi:hypothetical protein
VFAYTSLSCCEASWPNVAAALKRTSFALATRRVDERVGTGNGGGGHGQDGSEKEAGKVHGEIEPMAKSPERVLIPKSV